MGMSKHQWQCSTRNTCRVEARGGRDKLDVTFLERERNERARRGGNTARTISRPFLIDNPSVVQHKTMSTPH